MIQVGNNNIINARNNSFQDIRLSKSFGIIQSVCITNINTYISSPSTINGIETMGKKIVLVPIYSNSTLACNSTLGNKIYRINSTIAAGETIFIRADQGSVIFYPVNPATGTFPTGTVPNTFVGSYGGNIYLNGRASLTLTNGQAATFIKLDNIVGNESATYQLVSISN